ncbi:MAG: hypothetical protein HS115_11480 [Spirochaetales bacterium]|nr:hypothetical protein [Spirochaetales bacterium]
MKSAPLIIIVILVSNCALGSMLGFGDATDKANEAFSLATLALLTDKDTVNTYAINTSAAITRSTHLSIPHDTFTSIAFDTVITDTGGYFNTDYPGRLTAPVTGVYLVNSSVAFDANTTGDRSLLVYQDPIGGQRIHVRIPAASSQTAINGTAIVKMNAGDYVYIQAAQSSGGNLNVRSTIASVTGDNNHSPRFSIVRLE